MCGYCVQSWFIGVRFFKAEICFGSHSLRGYQWSLKDSGVRVGTRIARGVYFFGRSQNQRNSTWSWAKSIWFGVPILASIIVYICNVHWVGDLNLYSIHWLLGDLSVKLIWRSTITILHICKYVWCPLSWGPKYSFDMVYVDFLVAYYCLARTPEVLIPNLMQAEKVIL